MSAVGGRRIGAALFAALLCVGGLVAERVRAATAAETSIDGIWRTVDDATGKDKSLVRITESGGVYSGKIEKLLNPDPGDGDVCEKCTDDRKGQPLIGLTIIRHVKPAADEPGLYTGGDIVDPKNGKTYTLRLKLLDGGQRLQVRGYIGPFFRTQVWLRTE